MSYFFKYLLPGLGLLLMAFIVGSQEDYIFGFLGFLCFFVIAVILIIEGWKKHYGKKER